MDAIQNAASRCSPRWHPISVMFRGLPITGRLRQPPTMYRQFDLKPNHFRFRISPETIVTFGMNAIAPNTESEAASLAGHLGLDNLCWVWVEVFWNSDECLCFIGLKSCELRYVSRALRTRTAHALYDGCREYGSNTASVSWLAVSWCIAMKSVPGATVGVTKAFAFTRPRCDSTCTHD